jgi:hypothetical protein
VSNIAFFHIGSNKPKATEFVVNNIRSFHPNAPYILMSDDALDFRQVAAKHKTDYIHCNKKLGGPIQPFGYDVENVLEFLSRFRIACFIAESKGATHIMMAEDDVILVKPVTINKDWEMACHDISGGNIIPEPVITLIKSFSKKQPIKVEYGAGGGSIFKIRTFLENYDKVSWWFMGHTRYILREIYPTLGWIDCFMVVYYLLCGKDYTVNPHLTDTHNHQPGFDYESFISKLPEQIQIINNYKKYYYE